ncbi:MAG TPA: aspartate kinase [Bacteroidales bacterium]|nr:aspartate kinase [Bacteroidales bacterium]HRX98383.1 aspartate kinase [Bacteroidales bacterium]
MIVYKFGGASVKNANAVKNLVPIIRLAQKPLVIVVSAMGKTTNRLEAILTESRKPEGDPNGLLAELMNDHLILLKTLFSDETAQVYSDVKDIFEAVSDSFNNHSGEDYNFLYDQVIACGELVSSRIVSAWMGDMGIENKWIDVRKVLKTDSTYREAIIDQTASASKSREIFDFNASTCFVTQGFIGSDEKGYTTTLGREGSDYTAALLANFLDAEAVTLWKDVDGIYNADPAIFKDVQQVSALNYEEVIELTYYGAKVIHPKTIKPLAEKNIPLFVKSFNNTSAPGTLVGRPNGNEKQLPFIIVLENQILISISKKDLSFVSEINLRHLFDLLHNFRIKVNLMQHSAVSFSVCVDEPKGRDVKDLVAQLSQEFKVLYNTGLQLITVRNYSEKLISELIDDQKVLVEQRSRHTVQFVLS